MAAMVWLGFRPMSMAAAKLFFFRSFCPANRWRPPWPKVGRASRAPKLNKVIAPSPERVEPGCPYFGRCGGCHYQHIAYAAQLRYKAEILRETFRRTAKFELQQDISCTRLSRGAIAIARACT